MGNSLRDSLLMHAAMLGMAASVDNYPKNAHYVEERPPIRCGQCVHCPEGKKTFCKKAGHNTTRNTVANNCAELKLKDNEQDSIA